MKDDLQIGPVPPGQEGPAIDLLTAGRGPTSRTGRLLGQLLEGVGMGDRHCWWARRGRRCVAAAMVHVGAGRTGVLFFSPPGFAAVDPAALPEVLRGVAAEALERSDLSMVQSLVDVALPEDADVLVEAGFVRLAELMYMRMALTGRDTSSPLATGGAVSIDTPVEWIDYGAFGDERLLGVIEATHEQSLDCPALLGVREGRDVLASHRATGLFSPDSWWIARVNGQDAGCLLVNRSVDGESTEVVYLGVVRRCRGRNLAARMLRQAGRYFRQANLRSMSLAVDALNTYAIKSYERCGFRVQGRRLAYAMLRRDL